jgi:hypothetical protein
VRQHCRSNHFAPLSAALNPLTLCMCSCFSPAQRFQLHFETAGRSISTVLSARSSTIVVIIVGAAQRHAPAAVGMKLFGTSVKWTRYEPTLSPPLERIPCSPARHRAPSWLAGCPTLRRGKSTPHTHTTGSLERRAPLRPPRWQDASSLRTRWIQRESGGSRVPRRAPVARWSHRPCSGVVRGCARPVQRSLMYVQ